jgi:hypothetical protein
MRSLLVLEAWLFVIANQFIHGALFVGLHVFLAWYFIEYWYIVFPLLMPLALVLSYGWWVETKVMMQAFSLRMR